MGPLGTLPRFDTDQSSKSLSRVVTSLASDTGTPTSMSGKVGTGKSCGHMPQLQGPEERASPRGSQPNKYMQLAGASA